MTKSNNDFQKFMAIRILKENVLHHFAGFENSYRDGDMTKEEILEIFEINNFIEHATDELSRAMKKGNMLESPITNQVMEAKHLKFLGKETLEIVRVVGGANAFIDFKDFLEELKEEEKWLKKQFQ